MLTCIFLLNLKLLHRIQVSFPEKKLSPQETHIPALGNYDFLPPQTSAPDDVVPIPNDLASFLTEVPPKIPLPPHIKLPPGVPFPPLPPPPPSSSSSTTTGGGGGRVTEYSSSEERERRGGYYRRDDRDDHYSSHHQHHPHLSSPAAYRGDIKDNMASSSSMTTIASNTSSSGSRRIGLDEYASSRKRRSANSYPSINEDPSITSATNPSGSDMKSPPPFGHTAHINDISDYHTQPPPSRKKRTTSTSETGENVEDGEAKVLSWRNRSKQPTSDRLLSDPRQAGRYGDVQRQPQSSLSMTASEDRYQQQHQQRHVIHRSMTGGGDNVPTKEQSDIVGDPRKQQPSPRSSGGDGHPAFISDKPTSSNFNDDSFTMMKPAERIPPTHPTSFSNNNNHQAPTHFDGLQHPPDGPSFSNSGPLPPNQNFNYNERPPHAHFDGPRPHHPHNKPQPPINSQPQRPPFPKNGQPPFDHFNSGPPPRPCPPPSGGFQQQQPRFQQHRESHRFPRQIDNNPHLPQFDSNGPYNQQHHQDYNQYNQDGPPPPFDNVSPNQHFPPSHQQFRGSRPPPFSDRRRGRGGGHPRFQRSKEWGVRGRHRGGGGRENRK